MELPECWASHGFTGGTAYFGGGRKRWLWTRIVDRGDLTTRIKFYLSYDWLEGEGWALEVSNNLNQVEGTPEELWAHYTTYLLTGEWPPSSVVLTTGEVDVW